MDWKRRLAELILAGGGLAAVACDVLPGPIPCGNANPDPCICGRPDSNAEAKAACDVEKACKAMNLGFNYNWADPRCVTDDAAVVPDLAGTSSDGGPGDDSSIP